MFTGQAGCFCCSDPPDPPPPCEVCEACTGEAPGDCEDKVCSSFVIEVEGFANTTTVRNCDFVGPATGTACTAYNGTFVLEPVEGSPCVFRSGEFTATVPLHSFINNIQCYECVNEAVYYQLEFIPFDPLNGQQQLTRLSICRAIDELAFAYAYCSLPGVRRPWFGTPFGYDVHREIGSSDNPFVAPLMLCHEEPLQQFADSPLHPARFVTYSAVEPYSEDEFQRPNRLFYGIASGGWIDFIGQHFTATSTDRYATDRFTTMIPRTIDDCGQIKTTFFGSQEVPVLSPQWVCCKDESWDCDFVRDELATGNRDLQNIPLLRITSIRCGT